MAIESNKIVTPGERLSLADEFEAGSGTCIQGNFICASLVGSTHILPAESPDQQPILSVIRKGTSSAIPTVGDTVTARVTRIAPKQANLDILCVGTKPVAQRYTAILRQADVRATEIDTVNFPLCFRPGDIVRAQVLSLGDSRSYYLTTAKNELGVVYAKGPAGQPMIALNWEEMQCPVTKTIENRKVASTTTL